MHNFLKKLSEAGNNKNIILYIYFFLFIICFSLIAGQNIRTNPHDDILHSQAIQKFGSSWNFMLDQYKNWNSRYFTSLVMAYVMDKNIWLWRILNSIALFVFIIYSSKIISVIYNLDIKKYIILLLGVFASFTLLSSGIWTQSVTWVTGSFNYLWLACALSISFYYLFNSAFNKEKIKLYKFIILIPIILFACNTEQTALICVTMYGIIILYYAVKERFFDKYIFLLYIIMIISTLIVFLAPSVAVRYAAEIKTWYPVFSDLSILQKIVQGFPYTVLYGIILNNYTETIVLSVFLFIILKNQYNKKIYNVFALIPAFYAIIFYIGRVNTEWRDSSFIYNLRKFSVRYLDNNLNEPFISVIFGIFILLIMIYFLFKINWSSIERKYLALLFFAAALMSALILSFSPTIYVSGERIWFIPYTMYMLGIGMLFIEALKYINIKSKKFIVIFSIYFIVGIIDVFGKVYR